MSDLVRGVLFYRLIPPKGEPGVTAEELAEAIGVTKRTAERALLAFQRAGMARRIDGRKLGVPTVWWRS